jgi:uncharacterized protein YkwD
MSATRQRAEDVAAAIAQFVDHRRTERGRRSLATDADLAAIAADHSKGAARRGRIASTNVRGDPVAARVDGYRYVTTMVGSVTGRDRSPSDIARSVVGRWMDDQQRRRSLLHPGLDHNGIGVWIEDDEVYVTHILCTDDPFYRRIGAWLGLFARRLTAPLR